MSRRLPARKAAPARARLCRSPTDVTVGGSFEARLAGRCAPCPRSNQPSPVPSPFAATATSDFPRTCRLTYLLSARSACRRSLRIGPPVVMPSVQRSKKFPHPQSSFHCRRPAIGAKSWATKSLTSSPCGARLARRFLATCSTGAVRRRSAKGARPRFKPSPATPLPPLTCAHIGRPGGGCGLHPILLFEPSRPRLSFEPRQSNS